MKLLVCGKGGSGKSTITAMLALAFRMLDRPVLVVDADESNHGLHRMLGCDEPEPLMARIGGKAGFRERLAGGLGGPVTTVFPEALTPESLDEITTEVRPGLQLMAVGKIHHFGEGCACPMGRMFGMLFDALEPAPETAVIIDTAAGVEHFGRRLDAAADRIIAVVDPTFESIALAEKIGWLAREAGKPVHYVLNRTEPEFEDAMQKQIDKRLVLASLPMERALLTNNLHGRALAEPHPAITEACRTLESIAGSEPTPGGPSPFEKGF
jgi:CO dehydrogenase maturation factor